ncbi:MAG TPA: hypothetical protein VK171_15220 [Fimbriimonas sp.]|nr:hypothetical protein [Fimbriimonas sp.]
MKAWLAATPAVAAIWLGAKAPELKPIVNPPIQQVGLEAHDTHASASMLGQFRTSMSSSLFLRADLYLHGGVEMRPLSDDEARRGVKGVGGTQEAEKLHDDSKIVTVIPGAERDFRGIFGDVERSISSYRRMEGHAHSSPTQSLPLFRLMTWLDPNFIKGWTTGSFILLWDRKPGCVEKALALLNEGLKHNPKSIEILSQIAYIHLRDLSEIGYGGRHYDRALPVAIDAIRVGMENLKTLNEEERDALRQSFQRVSVCFREMGMFQEMKENSQSGLQIFPGDGPLTKHLNDSVALLKSPRAKISTVEDGLDKDDEEHDHEHDHDHHDETHEH